MTSTVKTFERRIEMLFLLSKCKKTTVTELSFYFKVSKDNTQKDSILYFEREDKYEITNNDNYIKIVDGKEFIETIGGNKDAWFVCKNNFNS